MERRTLEAFMRSRGMTQAELARRVGVSRQAVSSWFKQSPTIRISGRHLVAVAAALGTSVDRLVRPLPLRDGERRQALEAQLLWDRMQPTLDDFAAALARREPRAIARLVEVRGLYEAAKIAGKVAVWRRFGDYARFIPPTRRRQLEGLWRWKNAQAAS